MTILKLNKDQHRRPIGGHHFPEDGQTFRGNTLDEVVNGLSDYRINNSAPLGDPLQDVLRYYAQHWPFMVMEDYEPPAPETHGALMVKWMERIRKQWAKPRGRTVTPVEASHRWAICLKCPHNTKLVPATDEQKELQRKEFLLRAGQAVPEELGFCSLHSLATTVSVFSEAPSADSAKPKDRANYPGCWVA